MFGAAWCGFVSVYYYSYHMREHEFSMLTIEREGQA